MKGLDIKKIAEGFRWASLKEMRILRAYVEKRKDEEPVKFAPLYIDILYKIDELLKDTHSAGCAN